MKRSKSNTCKSKKLKLYQSGTVRLWASKTKENVAQSCPKHCEILGSYLQKHHHYPVFRAFFRQSHTARDRQIKRKYCPIGLLGTS